VLDSLPTPPADAGAREALRSSWLSLSPAWTLPAPPAVRGLPAVWRRRRAVQSARRVTAADLRRHMVGGVRAFGAGRVLQRSTPET